MNLGTMITIFLCVTAGLVAPTAKAGEGEVILNDILNPDFLPGNLLLDNVIVDVNSTNITAPGINVTVGDFNGALETMDFHRRMMNEYLCRGYVAEQILSDVMVSAAAVAAPRAEKRQGVPPPEMGPASGRKTSHKHRGKSDLKNAFKENLLADPGSAKYKKWLARTTTLEDIYRHYDPSGAASRQGTDGEEVRMAARRPYPSPYQAVGKTGYSSSGSGGGYSSYGGGGGGGGGKAMKAQKGSMKDTMDIAITAMAFLSFAMFKINILACLLKKMMSPSSTPAPAPAPTVMMLPSLNLPGGGGGGTPMFMLPNLPGGMMMMPGGGGGGPGGGGLDINLNGMGQGGGLNIGADGRPLDLNFGNGMMGRRRRREAGSDVAQTDEIARRALESLEAFHVLNKDGGQCLRLWLCENNKFSRELDHHFRIWLPLWSFGMSWIGGKMATSQSSASAMLENLRASVLGMGGSKCTVAYPWCSERVLARERSDRHRRRRRRSRRGDAGHP